MSERRDSDASGRQRLILPRRELHEAAHEHGHGGAERPWLCGWVYSYRKHRRTSIEDVSKRRHSDSGEWPATICAAEMRAARSGTCTWTSTGDGPEERRALRVYRNVLCEFYSGGLKNEAFQPRTLNDSLAHGRHHLA